MLFRSGDEFLGLLWRDKIHGCVGSDHNNGPYLLPYRITKSKPMEVLVNEAHKGFTQEVSRTLASLATELVDPLHVIRVLQRAKLIGMTPADGTGKLTNWLREGMHMEESMAWFAINTHAQGWEWVHPKRQKTYRWGDIPSPAPLPGPIVDLGF